MTTTALAPPGTSLNLDYPINTLTSTELVLVSGQFFRLYERR
ncbi:hypothetical protein [Hymenobacter gummosus]|nr:hypothetical protein [Hymenobacter gummosus]